MKPDRACGVFFFVLSTRARRRHERSRSLAHAFVVSSLAPRARVLSSLSRRGPKSRAARARLFVSLASGENYFTRVSEDACSLTAVEESDDDAAAASAATVSMGDTTEVHTSGGVAGACGSGLFTTYE